MLTQYDIGKLRRTQLEKGMSDEELAKEAGLGVATIWRIFRRDGHRRYRPTSKTIRKLAFALGIPLPELVICGDSDSDPQPPTDEPDGRPSLRLREGKRPRREIVGASAADSARDGATATVRAQVLQNKEKVA